MKLQKTPGPNFFQNLALIPKLYEHYPKAFASLSKKYGGVSEMKIPFRALIVNNPRLIHYVLKKNAKNYAKSDLYAPLRPILGNGLVTSEGETWRKNRRIIAPEFHENAIEGFVSVMGHYTQKLIDLWETALKSKESLHIDIADEMMALTLSVVSDVFFGDELGSQSKKIADSLYVLLDASVKKNLEFIPTPASWPTPLNIKVRKAAKVLDQLVIELIEHRRSQLKSAAADVLSRLLLARDKETGETLSDQQLLDEVKTLLLAGHETTSLNLSWTWYLLAKNPLVASRLRAEVDTVLSDKSPALQDLYRLAYTRRVLLESLRLFPPIPLISRQPLEDDEFEGVHIPKGINVQIVTFGTHRDPQFWSEADKFDPDRFINFEQKPDELTYFPFAAGPRGCIGEHFSMCESALILSMISKKFEIQLADPTAVTESEAMTTLRPKGGLKVVITKRKNL